MKRRIKNKNATHLSLKAALYERFLYAYLPQLSSLSHIKRINLFDAFGNAGLDRLGRQGTPYVHFHALQAQRQHRFKQGLPLKPFSLTMLSPEDQATSEVAQQQLLQKNALSNTCKIDLWQTPIQESIKKLSRQLQQQAAGEKNLLFIDPLGIPHFSFQDLRILLSRKAELILFLPLSALWKLHRKPEKTTTSFELQGLKQALDGLFPDKHLYWNDKLSPLEFMACLKEGLCLQDKLFTALEPVGSELPEAALVGVSADGFMMEKLLQALQILRPERSIPSGQQLAIFHHCPENNPPGKESIPLCHHITPFLWNRTDNKILYGVALQGGFLPAQLQEALQRLLVQEILAISDEKGKALPALPANCISYTAYKAAKAICYFSLKE